ncbi:hypothetical protein QM480_06510 [Flectobacillus sp. DC10W]|uniref:Uncharacterized protein n=1 Tax=Flectobacillus longus TaxID=2984207 RepID=A0ABT6YKI2_9BACT|nr:hypothetical protein [Flectobacillus longus]MDI9863967.1 hypothetical protein [Flectobacillus longus]
MLWQIIKGSFKPKYLVVIGVILLVLLVYRSCTKKPLKKTKIQQVFIVPMKYDSIAQGKINAIDSSANFHRIRVRNLQGERLQYEIDSVFGH